RYLLIEGVDVDERKYNHGSGNVLRVEPADHLLERDDRSIFGPVQPRDQRQHRTGFCSIYHNNRYAGPVVRTSRYFDRSSSLLTGCCGRRTYCERGTLSSIDRHSQYKNESAADKPLSHSSPPRFVVKPFGQANSLRRGPDYTTLGPWTAPQGI